MDNSLLEMVAEQLAKGSLVPAVNASWKTLVDLIYRRFATDSKSQKALEVAKREPDNPVAVRGLYDALARHILQDPHFGVQVRALWASSSAKQFAISTESANNQILASFVKGSVAQVRDVEGGIHFGDTSRDDR